jgi:hypothetical protein
LWKWGCRTVPNCSRTRICARTRPFTLEKVVVTTRTLLLPAPTMPKCSFSAGSDDCSCNGSSGGGGCPHEASVNERRRRSGDLQPTEAQAWVGHFIHQTVAYDAEKLARRKQLVKACCSKENEAMFLETTYHPPSYNKGKSKSNYYRMKTLADHISKVAGNMVALPAATCCCGSSSSSKVAVGKTEVEAALQAATAITSPRKKGNGAKEHGPNCLF